MKIELYEPAMCCSTGVCGPSVDTELLRISGVVQSLNKQENIDIERYNLTSRPDMFIKNKIVNELIKDKGADILPIMLVDDNIFSTSMYPTNEQIESLLNIKLDIESKLENNNNCCSEGQDCCK